MLEEIKSKAPRGKDLEDFKVPSNPPHLGEIELLNQSAQGRKDKIQEKSNVSTNTLRWKGKF